jgi:preprotein translocase subunit YajC
MSSVGFVLLQAQPGGADLSFFLMMGAIFLIFYMLVIRPQQKKQKERETFLSTAAKGDEIVTQGGIHGKVSAVDGEILEVEVARIRGEKVKLRVSLNRVDQLTKAGQSAPGDASDSDSKTASTGKGAKSAQSTKS